MTEATTGANLVAGVEAAGGPATIRGVDPRTGEPSGPAAHEATGGEVDRACAAAAEAADVLAGWSPDRLASMLEAVADAIEADGEAIVAAADRETALGADPRLAGELDRTTGQLRFLGQVARDGAQLGAVIDHRDGQPDLRRMRVPVGPVAVFGASNFPLAFSVAGGDTAAAWAAGCPAVVKAHPSHPATCELVGRAIVAGLERAGAPDGTFSLLHGFEAGQRLVQDPRVAAVAFTGSQAGGRALERLAAERDRPVPVHAEMGSLNPVVATPAAATARPGTIADGFVGSFTQGAGQFCTKPGLLFAPAGSGLAEAIAGAADGLDPAPLLNAGIADAWRDTTRRWADNPAVDVLAGQPPAAGDGDGSDDGQAGPAGPVAMTVDAAGLAADHDLLEECFGPTALVVKWNDLDGLAAALEPIHGSLAGGIHATDDDEHARPVMDLLQPRVGRLLFDGWPTGVAVTWAMHHGGPRPATTSPRETSVGAAAVGRFLRPVCYQNVPDRLLPAAVRDDNPLNIPQRVDGQLTLPGQPAS